jgi:hypothetical protein
MDPSELLSLPIGPSHDAEYDAVYAAVTETERGRWFLTEYAKRSRRADTDLVAAAIARIEAAVCGDAPQSSAAEPRDLTAIVGAVERIEAAIAAKAKPPSDVDAAAERIEDISSGLHERSVDAAFGDALDVVTPPPVQLEGSGPSAELRPADGPRWFIEAPDFVLQPPEREAATPYVEPSGETGQFHALLPGTAFQAGPQEGPQDGPAGLFEASRAREAFPPAPAIPAAMSDPAWPAEVVSLAEASPRELRVANGPAVRAVPRPAPSDPLAAMHGLSEDEVTALFG